MSSIAQMKNEKKLVDGKIEKVRQVVPSVSKNDIILALHSYDMDVQRTIQAFCEEGRQGALGDWENTTKPKKTKKSIKTEVVVEAPQSKQNGYSTNGFAGGATAPSSSSSTTKSRQPQKVKQISKLENIERLSGAEKERVLSAETVNLNTDLVEVQKLFEMELRNAESHVAQCFKEIRQAAIDRERQLVLALNQVRSEGSLYLSNRRSAARHLEETSDSNKLVSEMKNFLSLKQQDTDLAHATRFVYDNSKLVRSIAQFGEIVSIAGDAVQPIPVAPAVSNVQPIKHATSHSSIVSSVGEDSGLGQISPVSNGKSRCTAENGGIAMQSDGLSTDQLAEIQRQLAERLKAQGIDPSVLAGTGAPVTRRPPRKEQATKRPTQKAGNKKGQQNSRIELSILH